MAVALASSETRSRPRLDRIVGVEVPVSVRLAERDMPIGSILGIRVGTIVEFEVPFDSELALQVGDRTIAHGQAVKVGENFGLRIARIGSVYDRIRALSGQ